MITRLDTHRSMHYFKAESAGYLILDRLGETVDFGLLFFLLFLLLFLLFFIFFVLHLTGRFGIFFLGCLLDFFGSC